MTDDGEHVGHARFAQPGLYAKAFGKRGHDLAAGARRVREVLDLEMVDIANHALRQLRGQERLEGAVLVDGDFMAEGEQRRGNEYWNYSGLHSDWR